MNFTTMTIQHRFVDTIPDILELRVVYISIKREVAIHLCICGCGNEVVTPLAPFEWELVFDGETISLNPSIGNWQFPCRSHYFIKRNQIIYASNWTDDKIKKQRDKHSRNIKKFFRSKRKD